MAALSIWTEAFNAQCRKRDMTAHVIEHQEKVIREAIEALEKAEHELERAQFSLKTATDQHSELYKELTSVSGPIPQIMQANLTRLAEKIEEKKGAVDVGRTRVEDRRTKVDTAKENLAFDKEKQRLILAELATIAQRIEELQGQSK